MSKKEDLFSKLNIKDYNNQLENILENKSFTENTKNILLNILYKIETAYDDYKKVKVNVASKNELLEEIIKIIEENCYDIEIINPKINEKTKLGDKKFIIENNKIISYPNEKNLYYALNHLREQKLILNSKYKILKEPMEELFNQGYIIDKQEVIRDFDGWTWNIMSGDIENHIYNLVYQNIKILLGNDFLKNSIEYNKGNYFIDELENEIDKIAGENKKYNIANQIYKIAILQNIKDDKSKKKKILNTKELLKKELQKMENKKEYLQKIADSKKTIGKSIKNIDEIINSNKLLRENFIAENEKLEEKNKIFSLSEYHDIIQKRRKDLLKQLDEYSELMKPMNYVKKKAQIYKKYELLDNIDDETNVNEETYKLVITLQQEFIKLLNHKLKNIQSKKEIIEYIYLFRYYKLIYINNEKQIKDIDELKEDIRKTEKHIITKACKLKAMNILSQDIENNYELVSKILSYNIIELEDVNLEVKKHDKDIVLTIYDEDTIEDSIIYSGKEELNVKFGRKLKLFN